jgi:hypothetical protein
VKSAREAFRAAPTVNDLFDCYIAEHVERHNKPRIQDSVRYIVQRDLRPEFGQLKVAGITRQGPHKFHAAQAQLPGKSCRRSSIRYRKRPASAGKKINIDSFAK